MIASKGWPDRPNSPPKRSATLPAARPTSMATMIHASLLRHVVQSKDLGTRLLGSTVSSVRWLAQSKPDRTVAAYTTSKATPKLAVQPVALEKLKLLLTISVALAYASSAMSKHSAAR